MNDLKDILCPSEGPFIIILDGLDECGDPMTLKDLMKLVLMLDSLPPYFSILVSSRPEHQVISTWRAVEADRGCHIPHEDVDRVDWDEKFRTIRLMVDDGLRDVIQGSEWRPSPKDLDIFAGGCRELPIMASIRIRDVCTQVERASNLESEFEYFRGLENAPEDLDQEYLRILRRAYGTDSSNIRQRVVKNYRDVVGTIIGAQEPLNVYVMSQLLSIKEDQVHMTLRPINSIVDLPSDNTKNVQFFHATAREFITGKPAGNQSDEIFFISDASGRYFLGLPLLRFIDDVIKRNGFNFPTDLPLGDRKKWGILRDDYPKHVRYALHYLFHHLDPSQLRSQESNELQNELNYFLSQNFIPFTACLAAEAAMAMAMAMTATTAARETVRATAWAATATAMAMGGAEMVMPMVATVMEDAGAAASKQHYSILASADKCLYYALEGPRHLYRSLLPFIPSSSQLFRSYGHLSDPIQVFTISGKCSHHFIPLSEDALNEAKLDELRKAELEKGEQELQSLKKSQDARFLEPDARNCIVTSAALSSDGRYVALGFGSGIIEVADIDHQSTLSRFHCDPPNPPAWIEFTSSEHRIATEDREGNITIFGCDGPRVKLGTLRSDIYPPLTALSDDGTCIVRVRQNRHWYDDIAILHISDDPSIHSLQSKLPFEHWYDDNVSDNPFIHFPQSLEHYCRPGIWFSPGGKFVGAYDHKRAFVWSTESHKLIDHYDVEYFKTQIHNIVFIPRHSYHIPTPEFPQFSHSLGTGSMDPAQDFAEGRGDWGEFWRKCPTYDLLLRMGIWRNLEARPKYVTASTISSGLGRFPLFDCPISSDTFTRVFFNGEEEHVLPREYSPIILHPIIDRRTETWYGDRVTLRLHRPRTSKDGTRFLVQGRAEAPILVDISEVV